MDDKIISKKKANGLNCQNSLNNRSTFDKMRNLIDLSDQHKKADQKSNFEKKYEHEHQNYNNDLLNEKVIITRKK